MSWIITLWILKTFHKLKICKCIFIFSACIPQYVIFEFAFGLRKMYYWNLYTFMSLIEYYFYLTFECEYHPNIIRISRRKKKITEWTRKVLLQVSLVNIGFRASFRMDKKIRSSLDLCWEELRWYNSLYILRKFSGKIMHIYNGNCWIFTIMEPEKNIQS